MKTIHQNVLLIAASTLFALLVAEVAVRFALPRPGFVSRNAPSGLLVPDPVRHYAYAPGYVGEIISDEYRIQIEINALGLRDDPITSPTDIDVLAIGDSFTVGFGVEADDAWPSQLESYLNTESLSPDTVRVVNGGVSGYSLRQIRLLLEDLLALDPQFVVLGLYSSRYWRLSDPYVYFGGDPVRQSKVPSLREVDGGFIQSPIRNRRSRTLYFWLAENFYVGAYALEAAHLLSRKLRRSSSVAAPPSEAPTVDDRLESLLAELELINRQLVDREIGFLVLLVNDQEPDGSFSADEKQYNRVVKDYCNEHQIAVFDPLPLFESAASGKPVFRIGKDHHWSKHAHAFIGERLGAFLLQQGLLGQDRG